MRAIINRLATMFNRVAHQTGWGFSCAYRESIGFCLVMHAISPSRHQPLECWFQVLKNKKGKTVLHWYWNSILMAYFPRTSNLRGSAQTYKAVNDQGELEWALNTFVQTGIRNMLDTRNPIIANNWKSRGNTLAQRQTILTNIRTRTGF